ncbi:glycosyltransferase family 4 protein [Mucilaginibacter sp. McL0603]|uniref:glycosyltransferase family 4 protein n=1 Tax=Mucilaginibacter sp. McL0603 TaxID=3415670 RepID=UPI003CEA045F
MKKRIIVYGVNYFPARGGTSTVAENLILQLKDKYDFTVYCYNNVLAADNIPGVKVVQFKPLAKGSLGSLIYFFLSAIHILLFAKGDLIHAHKTDCAIFLPLLRLRFKIIATSHEAPYKRDKWNTFQKAYFHLAERIFIKSANICTCISEPLSRYYREKYGKGIYFIPNGINKIDPFAYDMEKAKEFIPDGASLHQPFILFSARRLMVTKGGHTILEALHKIKYKGQIFIAGELEENDYLQRLKKLSIGLNVFFLGYVTPLNTLLALVNASLLFIFPSETEGMSVMLLEVASVGKPIVASNIPENSQIFSADEVLYFQAGNAADLAEKIEFALSDKEYMVKLGKKAQERVYTSHLWFNIALQYEALYKKSITGNT